MKSKRHRNFHLVSRLTTIFLLVVFSTTAVVEAKTYTIYGDKRAGTKFRNVEATSEIPFNKSYKKLSADEKAIFRKNYDTIADNETPPFPSKGLQEIYNPIIKGHLVIADEGNLFIVAMINEIGKVEDIGVYESPSEEMTNYAATVLFNTKFDPATCSGEPCKMEFPFEFMLRPIEASTKLRSR